MRLFALMAAVLAVALAGLVALDGFTPATEAQGPPHRVFGTLRIDGSPAPDGTRIVAESNGRDCPAPPGGIGTGVVATSPEAGAGFYVLDVPADCGGGIQTTLIYFKVGSRYAAETACWQVGFIGGNAPNQPLNLTITGAAPRPTATVSCGAAATPAPTPEPTPEPTPTPAATPAPTPTPAASPFSLAVLDMNQPCIPAEGTRTCAAERLALWNGDQAAWGARFQAQGRPAPSADDVFVATLTFRVEAGDPATIGAIAQAVGWPHVRINAVRFRGREANEADEWIEVKNVGGAAQDMGGWSVRIPGTMISWNFADGFTLQPGQACKFYVGNPGADPCAGTRNVADRGVLPNDQGTVELWVNFLDLRAIRVSYSADPNNQPPPPNLQGFS